ncbi:MAG: hypothetical protein VX951_14465 [Planctomycetota bacterium]|nr:hypothetical protein [Planctomycetota bacterium]
MPRKRPGCLARLALFTVALLLSLVLAEVAVRIFANEVMPLSFGPRYMYQSDPELGITLTPGFEGQFALHNEFDVSISINSRGYRDREFGPKPGGVTRIISLSDSMGFGYGVTSEDSYPKQLETKLNENLDQARFEVLNAGAPARGIQHMIRVLERSAWFKPDVVIASFFFVNDLDDMHNFPVHTVRGGMVFPRPIAKVIDDNSWLAFSINYSKLSLLAYRAWFNWLRRMRGDSTRLGGAVAPPGRLWGTEALLTGADPDSAPGGDNLWAEFQTQLKILDDKTQAMGARLVLFTIPQEYLTRDEAWDELKRSGAVTDKHDRDLPGRKLTKICADIGVTFYDTVPDFRAKPPTETRFFPINKHFSPAGNAFVGEILAQFLRSKEFVR